MKVVLFVLDAFRYDYITKENTPFLWECRKQGRNIKHVIPSAGFCERTEIFTGLKPNESGFFTAIGYDPQKSTYRDNLFFNIVGKVESFLSIFTIRNLSISKIFRKIILKSFRFLTVSHKLKPYNIPFSFLRYFNLTEDEHDMETKKFVGSASIFEILGKKNKLTYLDSFTSLGKPSNGNDSERIKSAIYHSSKKNYIFIPIYIGDIDSNGHKFGPNSKDLGPELKKIDSILKDSVDQFLKVDEKTNFIFLGDHGMTTVKSILDVEKHIVSLAKKLRLKKGRDYIYFLDSTILRVWFLTENAKKKYEEVLRKDKYLSLNGKIINEEICKRNHIPIGDRRYGDLTWWANEGVLIFPDFFHYQKPYKGMHGYEPIYPSTYGTCIVIGSGVEKSYVESINLHEIYNLINELIDKED